MHATPTPPQLACMCPTDFRTLVARSSCRERALERCLRMAQVGRWTPFVLDGVRRLRHDRHALLPPHPQPAPPAHLLRRPRPRPRRPRAGPPARTAGRELPPHRRSSGDRIGQFYAAFPAGHATASAALQRLNRFQASNRFYAAKRELGRALKTEFVLQYMSEPKLRAKVRRGLLKVEQLHALARAVYYGAAGAHQRPRGLRPDERLLVPDPDPRLHHLLAGPGDLTAGRRAGLPVRPRPAAARQPDRVEERRPLRRDQDRPRQAHEATPLACISARMLSVP